MKLILAAIALALTSPGIYDVCKAVQARRNADAQAIYDREQLQLAAEKKRTEEQTAIAVAARAERAERARISPPANPTSQPPRRTWSYMPQTGRWVEHNSDVTAMRSLGGG